MATSSTSAAAEVSGQRRDPSLEKIPRKRSWATARRFAENRLAVVGLILIVIIYSLALLAPRIALPVRPDHLGMRDKPPSWDTGWGPTGTAATSIPGSSKAGRFRLPRVLPRS